MSWLGTPIVLRLPPERLGGSIDQDAYVEGLRTSGLPADPGRGTPRPGITRRLALDLLTPSAAAFVADQLLQAVGQGRPVAFEGRLYAVVGGVELQAAFAGSRGGTLVATLADMGPA